MLPSPDRVFRNPKRIIGGQTDMGNGHGEAYADDVLRGGTKQDDFTICEKHRIGSN